MYLAVFNKLDFQRVDPQNPRVPIGDPVTIMRGEKVPEWATEFEVSALVNAGMITYAADTRPDLVPIDAIPAQTRTPDQPPLLPSDPNGVPPLLGDRGSVAAETPVDETGPAPVDETAPLPALPKSNESKEVWETYAQHPLIGMTEAEAEGMNKTDLVTEVKRRHAISAQPVL